MVDGVRSALETNRPEERSWRNLQYRGFGAPAALRAIGWLGVLIAAPFFIWVPLATVTPLPSMVDVFGIVGLRIPASVTIGGLLLAAIGFHKF